MKRREAWFEGQLELDPGKLVFIDETGAATNMARLRGRAQKGDGCVPASARSLENDHLCGRPQAHRHDRADDAR